MTPTTYPAAKPLNIFENVRPRLKNQPAVTGRSSIWGRLQDRLLYVTVNPLRAGSVWRVQSMAQRRGR